MKRADEAISSLTTAPAELLSGQASPAPAFIKGWVIIESPDPLDVVAVYTVRGAGDVSIATDRVIPTRR